jgi:hypothetical protein
VAVTAPAGDPPRVAWVLAACALVLAPTLTYRIGVDQGSFAYMGAALVEHGRWPFIGTWENDFPGMVFLHAIEIAALGKSIAAFRAFDVLFQLVNAYFIFRIAAKTSGRAAGLLAAVLFCLIYQSYGPWNTAQREGFALPFVLGGYWLYLTGDRRPPAVTAFLAGLGLGLAVTFKPTVLAVSLFYLPLVAGLRSRRALAIAAAGVAGLLLPAAAIITGYFMAGGLTQMYEATIAYQSVYTMRLRTAGSVFSDWIVRAGQLGLHSWVLPLVYVPYLFLRHDRPVRLMLWLGYAGSLFSVWYQGTFAGYHYLPGLAIGAVLVGHIFSFAARSARAAAVMPAGIRPAAAELALALVLLGGAAAVYLRNAPIGYLVSMRFLGAPYPNEFRIDPVFDYTDAYNVAAYIRERTQPGQAIQVWAYNPVVYYLAERPAATRFQTSPALVMRVPGGEITPMQRRWRAEFLDGVARRPPAYIAVARGDHWWWAPEEKTSEQLLDDFPEWKAIIDRNYVHETTIGQFLLFRRAASIAAPAPPVT